MHFYLVPGGFSYLINYNSDWKKILGFRNMQEKLEKDNPFNFFFRLAFGVKKTAELKYYSFGNGHNIVGKSQLITYH
jgi:hypothetical protein